MSISLMSGPGTRRLARRFHAWCADRRGIAAVEFALIAVPFFFLMFGLLEIALLFIMSTVLEHSVTEVSRDIRTGQFQDAGLTEVAFKNMICDELFGLLACDARLRIDVKTFSDFTSTSNPSPIDSHGEFDDTGFTFDPGGSDDIVVVRVFYQWDLVTPILSKPLENMSNGRRLLSGVAVFRNEPFGD